MKHYIVVNIGCLECGVSTTLSKPFKTKQAAKNYAAKQEDWREGGQSFSEVFEVEL